MTHLSDAALRDGIADLEAIGRTRALTDAESDRLWRLVHIETCRIKARRRSIERNQSRLSLLNQGLPA